MTLTFNYKRVRRPNGIEVKSPMVPVILSGKGIKYQFMALLDSGADISVIPKDVAELLGLDLSGKREETRGLGSLLPAVSSTISIQIEKGHEHYEFEIPVKVILENNDMEIPVILGRTGFFSKFIITFDQKEEKVMLKHPTRSQ